MSGARALDLTRFGKSSQVGTLTRFGNPGFTSFGKSVQVDRGLFWLAFCWYRFPRRAGRVGHLPDFRSGSITLLLCVGPMPSSASASAVVIPAISSSPRRSDCGGRCDHLMVDRSPAARHARPDEFGKVGAHRLPVMLAAERPVSHVLAGRVELQRSLSLAAGHGTVSAPLAVRLAVRIQVL